MDRALVNDLALAFQLVSEKEKKRNKSLLAITKMISTFVVDMKRKLKAQKGNNNEK